MKSEAPLVAIVDDDPRIAESLGDLLESAGYTVCTFGSANALLENEQLRKITCLVTDIDIPLIDGFELANLVHARRSDLPVIFITGKSEAAGQERIAGLAPGRFFRKPFDSRALLTAIAASVAQA